MSKTVKSQLENFDPSVRAGRAKKFVLSELMPKTKTKVLILPLSEGTNDIREGKIAIATLYALVRDTGVSFLFGKNSKTGKREVVLVAKIPKDLKDLKWRLIKSKK